MKETVESSLLSRFLTEPTIRVLAGDTYFRRGLDYFRRGHVASVEEWENTLRATVQGTEAYAVEISATSERLDFECDCPLGDDGEFCKHCVAAALAWVNRAESGNEARIGTDGQTSVSKSAPTKFRKTAAKITPKEIASVLGAMDKSALIDLILEWAREEPGLRAKLTRHAAFALGPETAVREARLSLEKAIRIRGYVDYREAGDYAGGVDSAIDVVEKLVGSGHAAPTIELCEAGLRWLADACGNIDDSNGEMTELMERLGEIHLRACEAAKPDPVELAGRLFRAEMAAQYSEFSNSAERYAGVLGAEGVEAFRKLAEAEWAKVPAGEAGAGRRDDYSITRIMLSLAQQSGDVEQVVSILERDLRSPYRYLEIAEAYRAAGNSDKALDWAERGIAAFPDRPDYRLRLFLAEEYRRRDRHQEAIRTVWLEFQDNLSLHNYQLLEGFARSDDDWEEWRERALRTIRRELEAKPDPKRGNAMVSSWAHRKRDRSLLVEIFLYEGREQEAWLEAQAGGCSAPLWLRLAEAREAAAPEDSVPVYLRLAEAGIANPPGHRYDGAVELLERAARLQQSLGRVGEFRQYLDALRKTHKPKRNFQKRVEERRRWLYLD